MSKRNSGRFAGRASLPNANGGCPLSVSADVAGGNGGGCVPARHASDNGAGMGVRRRATSRNQLVRGLIAALALVCCVVPFGVRAMSPASARAAGTAGWCTPTAKNIGDITMGSDTANATTDYGIATYAGGGINLTGYVVESEGLMATPGNMVIDQQKASWGGRGFRFGTVGFGAQYRPTANIGATAVAVGGTVTKGSTHGGWIAKDEYQAQVGGSSDQNALRTDTTSGSSSPSTKSSWWNWSDPLNVKVTDPDNVNGTVNKDYSDFTATTFTNSDSTMNSLLALGSSTASDVYHAQATASQKSYFGYVTRNRYDYGQSPNASGYTAKFTVNEKVITFTGDNKSRLQVFDLPASLINGVGVTPDTNTGISWDFEDIPDGASVVVNVTGDASGLTFRNGWRFIWNGTDIGDGYSYASSSLAETYSTAAQSVMWNFAKTGDLTILGGKATNATIKGDSNVSGTTASGVQKWGQKGATFTASSTNDPAAAMIGSIMVNGSFTDHVTTNGRVYVKDTFTMTNSADDMVRQGTQTVQYSEGPSTSIIDMDSERHNFPWVGTYLSTCATIRWGKADTAKRGTATLDDTSTLLPGSKWGVYASESDATGNANAIAYVTDGDTSAESESNKLKADQDGESNGIIVVSGLTPNATYYIRETTAPSGYSLNSAVYTITAGAGGSTATLATGNGIVFDTKKPGTVAWTKKDSTVAGADLAGSVWELYQCSTKSDPPATCTAWTDKGAQTSTTGRFTVADIAADATYKLIETSAPAGYDTVSTPFYFIGVSDGPARFVDGGGNQLADGDTYTYDSANGTNLVADTRKTGSVTWKKTDEKGNSGNDLAGSEWSLTFTPDAGGSPVTKTVKDWSDASATPACDASTSFCDTDSAAGTITLTGLEWGAYTLTETKAPAGHVLDATPHEFTIARDKSTDTVDVSKGLSKVVDLGSIKNETSITALPLTGGEWTPRNVVIAGLIVLGVAAVSYGIARRRRRK